MHVTDNRHFLLFSGFADQKIIQVGLQNNELLALEFSETVLTQPLSYKLQIFAGPVGQDHLLQSPPLRQYRGKGNSGGCDSGTWSTLLSYRTSF